ncbi:MAG: glycerol kinase GlpK [Chloroflexi bacterium]|nr:glycerol kinase GlpK [Chloroflexota bacterium]
MDAPDLILALDQGTTSSRAIAFDREARPVASAQQAFEQRFPSPGHVTHDPEAIWASQVAVAREVVDRVGGAGRIAAIGITNQRETTIVWDRATGRPVADAIVWQSRITAPACDRLRAAGHEALFRERTGLPLDAYFSGPKIAHILDAGPGLRTRAEGGELAFGTVDTFLAWRLTGGRVHVTDPSNASRTLLFGLRTLDWDDELLRLVGVPRSVLPTVAPTSGVIGATDPAIFGRAIPIAALVGDQQAATFGQACFAPGESKVTYGTGAFLLRNVGEAPVPSRNRLLSTVLWQLEPGGPATYALEGSVFVAGAAVQWLRDGLRVIDASADVERLAASVEDTGGVYMVPAFTGLGAPYWDPDARGAILGITRGTGFGEIARATLDGIAHQVADVVEAMTADTGVAPGTLRADGGAAANDGLLQFQADLLGVAVERPMVTETTALGAAGLAGVAVGFWSGPEAFARYWALERRFEPAMDGGRRADLRRGWARAVARVRGWASGDARG